MKSLSTGAYMAKLLFWQSIDVMLPTTALSHTNEVDVITSISVGVKAKNNGIPQISNPSSYIMRYVCTCFVTTPFCSFSNYFGWGGGVDIELNNVFVFFF